MSFKETRELEELPSRLEQLEAEHARLVEELANVEIYKSDPQKARESSTRLAEIETETTIAFARWEELEAMQNATV